MVSSKLSDHIIYRWPASNDVLNAAPTIELPPL